MKERTKNILIALLVVGLVSMTVAYAALTQVLNINASAKVIGKDSVWNIHFENLSSTPTLVGYAQVEAGNEPTVTNTSFAGLTATLRAPGDSVSYTFDVTNDGAVDAEISGVFLSSVANATVSSGTSAADEALVKQNVTFTLVDNTTGNALAVGETLAHGATRTLKLTIAYSSAATDMPSATVTLSGLSGHVDFEQA